MATGNNGIGMVSILKKGISFVTATPVQNIGDRVLYKGDEYVYVYAKTTCPIGNACCVSYSTSYSVTISSVTDSENGFLGVVKHVIIPTGEYGWILTKGFTDVVSGANTALSLGNQLIVCGTTGSDGNISRITLSTQYSNGAGFIPRPIGMCLQSGVTESSGAWCYIS